MAERTLFVISNHPHASDIPAVYHPALDRDLEACSKIRDQPQSCYGLVDNTRGLPTGIQLTDGDCHAISSDQQRPAIREDRGRIPTTNGTVILPMQNYPIASVTSPKIGGERDEAKPLVSRGGGLREISSFADARASLGAAGRLTLSLNARLEAIPSQWTSGPYHSPSITSPTSDAFHPATTTTTTTTTVDGTSLWRVKARKVLDYLVTKHPKVVSAASATLVAMGNIASHAGVSACVGGPILVVVQSVGAMTVAIGEWLRTALDSAAKAPTQMQPSC